MAISSNLRGQGESFVKFESDYNRRVKCFQEGMLFPLEVDGVKYYITDGELEDLRFGLECGDLRLIKQIITDMENRALADKMRLDAIKSSYYKAYREDFE